MRTFIAPWRQAGSPKYSPEVPIDKSATIDPSVCCKEDEPGRGKMKPNPIADDVVIWETNIGAAGVRRVSRPNRLGGCNASRG